MRQVAQMPFRPVERGTQNVQRVYAANNELSMSLS